MIQDVTIWGLERREGVLRWAGCSLPDLAEQHGTPLYVVNADVLARACAALRTAFEAEDLDARLFFSFKTNPVPAVLRRISALGCGAEVISEFEYWLATRLGIGGGRIVVNGPCKSPGLIRCAVTDDVALVNLESLEDLQSVRTAAERAERPVNVGLRVNPCLRDSAFDFTVATGSRSSHTGFRRGSREWVQALELLQTSPRLVLRGLHFHIGSGVRSAGPYVAATKAALAMWTDVLDAGFSPTVLDIGGGFAAGTLKGFNLLDAVRFFGWRRPPAESHVPGSHDVAHDVARACATVLRDYCRTAGIPVPTVYVEPGRALVASSQLLLLRVVSLRSRRTGIPVAVCDAGAMSVSPVLLTERHEVLLASAPGTAATTRYDVVGNLPTPLDIVALGQELPALAVGDLLAVTDVGAYCTSLGNNFGGPRLPIVLIENGAAALVRERETFREMVMRDVGMGDGVAPR